MELVPMPERSPDPGTSRAAAMIGRARMPMRIAIGLVAGVVVCVPVVLGLPGLSLAGVAILLALAASLMLLEGRPELFRRGSHLVYGAGLAAVAYAIFALGLPSVISVYFPAIVLLGAAQILGTRAAVLWGVPSLALVAAGVYAAPPLERAVSADVTFAVRAAVLLTILAFGVSFRRAHDRQAAELEQRAITDPLTGLANRVELQRALDEALKRCERFGRHGAVVFVDLDGVKRINDGLGHAAGDQLILEASQRIRAITRSVDTAARVGGDEFVILLSEFEDPKGGELFGRKLLANLCAPCRVAGEELEPSASVGVAEFPDASARAEELLSLADAAMYQAKRAGGRRGCVRDASGVRELLV